MKKILFFLLFISSSVLGQTFTAETGDIYIGEPKGNYYGIFIIKTGMLKSTDVLEIYSNSGFKYTARIIKITDLDTRALLKEIKSGQSAFIDFFTADDPGNYNDALRKGFKVYPKGVKPDGKLLDINESKRPDLLVTLDSKPFRAALTYKGAVLWRKGVKNYANNKPYLLLQFGSVIAPDDRIISIQIFNPKEMPTKYSVKDMEVNFSGSIDGKKENTTIYGFVNGKADTDFTIEITRWQIVSDKKAIISGKIYGELREVKILGIAKKINRFENGSFENIEIEIMNNQPDLKEMIKAEY
ncbi:hypothetical protein [Emticicia fontis]